MRQPERKTKDRDMLPCPFCGGKATLFWHDGFRCWYPGCTEHGCILEMGADYYDESEFECIRAWNMRPKI